MKALDISRLVTRTVAQSKPVQLFSLIAMLLFMCGAANRSQTFGVSIVPQFGETPVSDGRLLLIDPPQGHDPPSPHLLEVNVTPPLSAAPRIAWTASHGIRLILSPEFGFGVAPRPAGASIDRANSVGPFSIRATIGPPVNYELTIPGFAYESIELGCASGFAGGYKVDARGVPAQTDTVRDSDIYVTSPVVPVPIFWNHCSKDFQSPVKSNSTLFIPGGAIDLPDGRGTFSDVDGSRWKGPVHYAIDPSLVRGTLLWRTRDGHLVKTLQQDTGENLIGQTIMAHRDGRFADNGWLKGAKPEQRAVSDTALESLQYVTTISDDASPFTQYGMPQPIELMMPYRGGVSLPDRPSSICIHTDPQLFPAPGTTWSLVGGLGAGSRQPPILTAAQAVSVSLSECETIKNPRPGWFEISASVRAPVSHHVSRSAVIYDSVTLTAHPNRSALLFIDDRATPVASLTESDLYLSKDGVLHFPSGGTLLTNGTDPSLSLPRNARAGSAFSQIAADAWRNDRNTLNASDWQAADKPCQVTKADNTSCFAARCGIMTADVLLCKTRAGRYVKLHIIDFYNASLGAAFHVSDARGEFSASPATSAEPSPHIVKRSQMRWLCLFVSFALMTSTAGFATL